MPRRSILLNNGGSPDQRSDWRLLLMFLLVFAIGVYLRLQQISIQWLTDDEWHAIHKLVNSDGYWPIVQSFGRSDYSIPLTLFYKLLADTIGLSELRMRAPMLLCGAAFLALSLIWTHKRFGYLTAGVFGFLVAISPVLVSFSRNARPYMITLLVSAVGIWALARWTRNPADRKHIALYLLCAWSASYLHLVMAPFLLAPLLVVGYLVFTRKSGITPLAFASTCLAAGVGIILTIGPPLLNDLTAIAVKTGRNLPDFDTLSGVWYIWLGTGSTVVVIVGITLAILGLHRVWATMPLELAMWTAGLIAIVAAIVIMRPAWVQNPVTFGRYLLPALPLLLLAIAAGTHRVGSMLPRPGRILFASTIAAGFLLGSPHPSLLQRPNNFTLHTYHQFDYRPGHNPVRVLFNDFDTPSPFWKRFQHAAPGRFVIAVSGQPSFESYNNLQPVYQPLHRQTLLRLQTSGACSRPRAGEAFPGQGIHLRNAVSLSLDGDLDAKQVDWIVIDRRMEMANRVPLPKTASQDMDDCTRYLKSRFGDPDYADQTLVAFRIKEQRLPDVRDVQ